MTFLKSLTGTDWMLIIVAIFFGIITFMRKRRGTSWLVISAIVLVAIVVLSYGLGGQHLHNVPIPHLTKP